MKKLFTLSIAFFLIFTGCKKEKSLNDQKKNNSSFLDSTIAFLKNTLSPNDFATLDWNKFQVLRYNNKNIGIQVLKNNSENIFLILQYKNHSYSGNWVDMSQLNTIHPRYKSGNVTLESIDKKLTTILTVDSNEVIELNTSDEGVTKSIKYNASQKNNTSAITARTAVSIPIPPYQVLPEIVIYIGNNGLDDLDYGSLFWMLNEDYNYYGQYYPVSYGGGGSYTSGGSAGGSSSSNNVVSGPTFFAPDEPITNLFAELKCFTNNSTSTYSISVNVNQPFPNSRDVLNPLAVDMVGHTFLSLVQHNADGTSIIRNVGFYPKHAVKPGSEVDQSVFGEDSQTEFDVSLQFTITGTELITVINRLLDDTDLAYNLDDFNCTNVPIDALGSIHINLPSTKSTGALFSGNDPADLGEDIRALNLDNFSAANGNRKVVRTVSNSNNLKPQPKAGTC